MSSRRRPKTLLVLSLLGLATPFQASSGSSVGLGKFGGAGVGTGGSASGHRHEPFQQKPTHADKTIRHGVVSSPPSASVGAHPQPSREARRPRGELFAKDPVRAAVSSPTSRLPYGSPAGVVGRMMRGPPFPHRSSREGGRRSSVVVRKDNGLVLQSTAAGLVTPLLHDEDDGSQWFGRYGYSARGVFSDLHVRGGAQARQQQAQQAQELTRRLGKMTASAVLGLVAVELLGRLAGLTAGGATLLAPTVLSPAVDRTASILSLVLGPLFTVSLWSNLAPFASIALKLSPMPTIQKVRREGTTGGLPLLPYSAMCTMTFVLVCYGLLIQDTKIIVTHGAGHLISLFYCLSFYNNVDKEATNLPGTVGMHARTALGIAGATIATIIMLGQKAAPIVGMTTVLLSCIMYTGPLAALRAAIESKSARNIPLPYAVASTANAVAWFVYGFFRISDFMVWAPCAIGVASATAQIVVNILYGDGPDAAATKEA